MKKIFLIVIMTILVVSALSIAAFAADPVMHVLYGSLSKDFEDFEDGWNFAMEEANGGKEVHVTLLADWTADEDGGFTDDVWNGDGFDNDTIYFADDVSVTLDLGGYTIENAGEIIEF